MRTDDERALLRRLRGELPEAEARELDRRTATDPELAGARRCLEAAWQALDLPAPGGAPPGFGARVMARVREDVARREAAGRLATWPGRLAAATALVAGIALGIGGARWAGPFAAPAPPAAPAPAQAARQADPAPVPSAPPPAPEAVAEVPPPAPESVADGELSTSLEGLLEESPDGLAASYLEALTALEDAS
jgi:anti-sigma factor RsiW